MKQKPQEKEITPLAQSLRTLYAAQNKIPKLIDNDDNKLPEQEWSEYYIKLQMVLDKEIEGQGKAAANDKVEGKKVPIEIDDLFSPINKEKDGEKENGTETSKVILLGGAGVGKTTMLDYIAHSWGSGTLWNDKYDYVFRLHLKKLLSKSWESNYTEGYNLGDNRLSCFIDYCLYNEKIKYGLEKEAKTARQRRAQKDKRKKEYQAIEKIINGDDEGKILFLTDGYDEIDMNDESNKKVIEEIIELSKEDEISLILSSRPNAAVNIKKEFDRSVESQGFDYEGIKQYIEVNFKENIVLGQDLLSFITNNSQINDMCTVPINTALICLIWGDPEVRQTLSKETEELNLSALYDEVVLWLGKRYVEKFDRTKTKSHIKDAIKGDIFSKPELLLLKEVAYKSFVETGKLVTKEVFNQSKEDLRNSGDARAAQIDETALDNVLKFGLLRSEGEHYQFIHLSFQEYLAAYYLKEKLKSNTVIQDKKINYEQIKNDKGEIETKEVKSSLTISPAEFIANHRNEPKYLMMLKFLAGLISNDGDQSLVTKFWEAVSCNIEGIIELGLENKVKLFMHLLAQSKTKGRGIDKRIPNLDKIREVIDEEVDKDLSKWSQDIIESGYLSPTIIKTVKDALEIDSMLILENTEQNNNSNNQDNTRTIDKQNLLAALEIRSSLVNKEELGSKGELYETLLKLVKNEKMDWRLTNFALEKLLQITDDTILQTRFQEEISQDLQVIIKQMLSEANVSDNGSKVINKISNIVPQVKREIYETYKKELTSPDNLAILQDKAGVTKKLTALIKTLNNKLPEEQNKWSIALLKNVFEFVENTIKNNEIKDNLLKRQLMENICKLIKASSMEARKKAVEQALQLIEKIISDDTADDYGKYRALDAVPSLLEASREEDKEKIAEQVLQLIEKIIGNDTIPGYVKGSALEAMPKVLEASREEDKEKIAEQAWQLIEKIIRNDTISDYVKYKNIYAMLFVLKASREEDKEKIAEQALQLIEKITSDDTVLDNMKTEALRVIPYVLEAMQSEQALQWIEKIISDDTVDKYMKGSALEAMTEVLKASREEDKEKIAEQAWQLIEKIIGNDTISGHVKYKTIYVVPSVLRVTRAKDKEKIAEQALQFIGKIIGNDTVSDYLISDYRMGGALNTVPSVLRVTRAKDKEKIAEQAWQLIEKIIGNDTVSGYVKSHAVGIMPQVLRAMQPEQALQLIEKITSDDKVSDYLMRGALGAVPSVLRVTRAKDKEKIAEQAWQLIEKITSDDKVSYYLMGGALDAVPSVLEASREEDKEKIAEQAWQFIEKIIGDDKVSSYLMREALDTMSQILEAIQPEQAWQLIEKIIGNDTVSDDIKSRIIDTASRVLGASRAEGKEKIAEQVWQLIEKITSDDKVSNDMKSSALYAVPSVLKASRGEDKEKIAQQAWQLLKEIIGDNMVSNTVKGKALYAVPSVLKASREEDKEKIAEQAWQLIEKIIGNDTVLNNVKENALYAVPSVLKASREEDKEKIAQQAWQLIEKITSDDTVLNNVKKNALDAMLKVLKAIQPEQAWQFIKNITSDDTVGNYLKYAVVYDAVPSALKAIQPEQAWQYIKNIIGSNPVSDNVKENALEAMPSVLKAMSPEQAIRNLDEIVNINNTTINDSIFNRSGACRIEEVIINLPLNYSSKLLNSNSSDLRKLTSKALKSKLDKEKYTFEELPGLLKVIAKSKLAGAEQQELNKKAKDIVKDLGAEDVTDIHIRRLNEYFEEIERLNIPETRLCLKAVYNAVLRDGVITEEESKFIVNCINKLGFTSTIRLKGCSILFEDVTYNIKEGSEHLTAIVKEVVTKSDDVLAQQYRSHKPLFKNSGAGLKVAAVDRHELSLVDKSAELELDKWYVSLMHLSDHKFSKPSNVFVLIERRGELGEHLIHQIWLEKDILSVKEYIKSPDQIDTEFRKEIFGEMEYNLKTLTKPRYFGSSYQVDLEKGKEIIEKAKENNNPSKAETVNMWLATFVEDVKYEETQSWEDYIGLWEDAIEYEEIYKGNIKEFHRIDILAEVNPENTKRLSQQLDVIFKIKSKIKAHREENDEYVTEFKDAIATLEKIAIGNEVAGTIEMSGDNSSFGTDS